mgnify:FL=1
MPEISFCLFDMGYLFKLFPKKSKEFNDNMKNFENKFEGEMAENRARLFEDYNYSGEFQQV